MIQRGQECLTEFTRRIRHSGINDIGLWYWFATPIPKSNSPLSSQFLTFDNSRPRSSHAVAT